MYPILSTLEPFAMDLWRDEIDSFLPERDADAGVDYRVEKENYFGGLYQKVVVTKI